MVLPRTLVPLMVLYSGIIGVHALFGRLQRTSRTENIPGFITFEQVKGEKYNVTYDTRAILVNGKPTVLLSGSIHYPRSTPAIWRSILLQAKADGLNCIQTYVFWNLHQPTQEAWDFTGNKDLLLFLDMATEAGLFVNLRIGPYVCAEWSYGGYPVWVGKIPRLEFRRFNQPWLTEMEKFVRRIARMVESYLARNGGPIILAQIENEYHENNSAGLDYIAWCGKLTTQLALDIPWVMCNGLSANETINTCNGNDCTSFLESNGQSGRILIDQPAMWTENEGWFTVWGQEYDQASHVWRGVPYSPSSRNTTDLAYAVARFFARGGSYHNYYMYYGGNHFGLVPGSAVTTMYAPAVNFDAFGRPNEPKKSHMNRLHVALARYAAPLMQVPAQLRNSTRLSNSSQALLGFIYSPDNGSTGIAFLENSGYSSVTLNWDGETVDLSPLSVQLRDLSTKALVFDTSDVTTPHRREPRTRVVASQLNWKAWAEQPTLEGDAPPIITNTSPYNQVDITNATTEYMLYQTTFTASKTENTLYFDFGNSNAIATFVNGHLVTDSHNVAHTLGTANATVSLTLPTTEATTLTFLSVSLGIDNLIAGADRPLKGLVKTISLNGRDLTSNSWKMRPFLQGELRNVYSAGAGSVPWTTDYGSLAKTPLVWYQATFSSPIITGIHRAATHGSNLVDALLVDTSSLSRGRMYINGNDIGRYWTYQQQDPTQSQLFIPPDWLSDTGRNTITLVDELGNIDIEQVVLKVTSGVASFRSIEVRN